MPSKRRAKPKPLRAVTAIGDTDPGEWSAMPMPDGLLVIHRPVVAYAGQAALVPWRLMRDYLERRDDAE